MTGVFGNLGIDPFYAFLILLILQVALLVVLVLVYDKYKHLEKVFNTFMKGKNGKIIAISNYGTNNILPTYECLMNHLNWTRIF